MMGALWSPRQPRNGDEDGASSTVPRPDLSAALTPGEATGHPTPYTPLWLPGASSRQACPLALSPVLHREEQASPSPF